MTIEVSHSPDQAVYEFFFLVNLLIILILYSNVVLAKSSSSILNTRLLNFSNNHKILHRSQIGFVPGHRASEHIFSR